MGNGIALYLPNLGGGGAQRVMVNLAGGMSRRGLEVDLVVAGASGPLLADVPAGANLVDLGSRGVLASLPRLASYIRRERPAAMLSTMSHCNVVAVIAVKLAGADTSLVIREANPMNACDPGSATVKERAVLRLMKSLYGRADMIGAKSLDTASALVTQGIALEDRVRVIHNPVVGDDLALKREEEIDHPWLGDKDVPVILAVGRLVEEKDHPTLVRAFGIVLENRPARLVILGEGPLKNRLLSLARELGIADRVDLHGYAANPHPYFARASLVALSSRWEGFGNVLVEAMAAGTPVVSTDCPGGPHEILDEGRFGRLVPVGDARALAAAILDTLDDPPSAESLVERAKDFSIEKITSSYVEVLGL